MYTNIGVDVSLCIIELDIFISSFGFFGEVRRDSSAVRDDNIEKIVRVIESRAFVEVRSK